MLFHGAICRPNVAGVDEVGRSRPVVAAAVVLDDAAPIDGLADLKLSEKKRETLAAQIKATASSYALYLLNHCD